MCMWSCRKQRGAGDCLGCVWDWPQKLRAGTPPVRSDGCPSGALHMCILAAERRRLLVNHSMARSVALRLLRNERILTCLHMRHTAGVPGCPVVLWEAMLGEYQKASSDRPHDRPACGMCCYASGDFHTEPMAHLHCCISHGLSP